MIIPFERLYDFFDQVIDEDTIIYLFKPPGSKKVSDIHRLNSEQLTDRLPWSHRYRQVPILFHDQEPLNFDLYQDLDPKEMYTCLHDNLAWGSNILAEDFDRYLQFTKDRNLKFFLPCQTVCDKPILIHSEQNSQQVTRYQEAGWQTVHYWSHAMIARDWYRFAAYDRTLSFTPANFSKDFNVYLRGWTNTREYRLKFFQRLVELDFLDKINTKFSPTDDGIYYKNYHYKNHRFQVDIDLENHTPLNFVSSCYSASYEADDYKCCAIDVVLETLYDDTRQHLTEKILRPIACGKPFLLMSTPGALRYLKSYGFRTFSDFVDESYDDISDPILRMESVLSIMKNISALASKEKMSLFQNLHQIAQENKKLFWSEQFGKTVLDELLSGVQAAAIESRRCMTGQDWIKFRKHMYQGSQTMKSILTQDHTHRPREEVVKLMLSLK